MFTSIPTNFAVKKWSNSWIIIKKLMIKKGINDAVKIEIRANKYTEKLISILLDIVFII